MSRLLPTLLGGLLLALATAAEAGNLGTDHFSLGDDTTVTTPVTGDDVLIGGRIDVQAPISGSLYATGGSVRIQRTIGRDLYAAGGEITLAAPVTGNARLFSGQIEITPEASIHGNASLAADSIQLRGTVGGHLELGGKEVLIDSAISGDVDASGTHIVLGPNARISGRLRYASPAELERDAAAEVHGSIEHTARRVRWSHGLQPDTWIGPWGEGDEDGWKVMGGPFQGTPFEGPQWRTWLHPYHHYYGMGFLGGMAVLTALVIGGLLPGFAQRLGATVNDQWGWSIFLGLTVLIGTPILAVVLCVTIIGIPLAVALVLAWLLLMFLGYAASGVAFGDAALAHLAPNRYHETALRVIAAVLAMVLVVAAARTPIIGSLVSFTAMLTGIGALLLAMRRNNGQAGNPA